VVFAVTIDQTQWNGGVRPYKVRFRDSFGAYADPQGGMFSLSVSQCVRKTRRLQPALYSRNDDEMSGCPFVGRPKKMLKRSQSAGQIGTHGRPTFS
jgi:hypothetical protein